MASAGDVEFFTDQIDEKQDLEEQQIQTQLNLSELTKVIQVASEGALAVKTVASYRRLGSYHYYRIKADIELGYGMGFSIMLKSHSELMKSILRSQMRIHLSWLQTGYSRNVNTQIPRIQRHRIVREQHSLMHRRWELLLVTIMYSKKEEDWTSGIKIDKESGMGTLLYPKLSPDIWYHYQRGRLVSLVIP